MTITHQYLIRGTVFIAGVTVIFYLGGVNWSAEFLQGHLRSALFAYLLAVVAALVPYGILVSLLENLKRSAISQVFLFSLVVALPIICFGYWRLNHINTGGWDYFIIPFWQLILLMLVNGLYEIFVPAR